ncbi:MAG TPA: hypothetical protein PLO43_02710 [Chlamydiales bacterium]|nr:hypothetical protein [Chlamydiales bacterium]HPE85072.1 hypothetical protein [Chlamydiales bacterium]
MIDPKISQIAAELTAAALVSLFPKVTLIEARHQRYGFSVDAIIPKSFSKEAFPHIEERIFRLPAPKRMEMVGSNAAEYLRSSHQVLRADLAKSYGKNIVSMVQIGDFVDFCPFPCAETIGGLRLLDCEQEDDQVRIIGAAHETSAETKAYVKKYQTCKKNDHMRQFEVVDSEICWSQKHESMRFNLICKWRQWMHENGGQIYDGPKLPSNGFCGKMISIEDGEGIAGLLDLPTALACQLHNPPPGAVEKFLSSFGLQITKNQEKFTTPDAYGTFWCIGTEKLCYASLERLYALMIENNCEELLC